MAGERGLRLTLEVVVRPLGRTRPSRQGREPAEVSLRDREGETLRLHELLPEQHFTQPPPRFSQATLIKELEEKGVREEQLVDQRNAEIAVTAHSVHADEIKEGLARYGVPVGTDGGGD